MTAVRRDELEPFITLDGSEIREYAGPRDGAARKQSLAEAIRRAQAIRFDYNALRASAERFSLERFQEGFRGAVKDLLG